MKTLLTWFIIFILTINMQAQWGLRIGYNVSRFPAMRNLQIPVYNFNQENNTNLKAPRLADGIMLGVDIGTHGGIEFLWMNKSAVSKEKFASKDSTVQIKCRYNSFGIGAFFPISEDHRFGVNCDIGKTAILKKKGLANNDTLRWETFYTNSTTFGINIYLNFCYELSEALSIHIRPHYQLVWPIGMPEYNSEDYYFKFHNLGISTSILIGKGGN